MSKAPVLGDLEVREDLRFLRRMWKLQRVGWAVLGLVVAAGLTGLFGSGPASRATAADASVVIDYARFARRLAPTELRVRISAMPPADTLRVALSNRFLDAVEVSAVKPPPLRVERGAEQSVYVFAGVPDAIVVSLRHLRAGPAEGRLSLAGSSPLAFRTLVYP